MKSFWSKKGSMVLALVVGVMSGAAIGADLAPAAPLEPLVDVTCPTPARCQMANRSCQDPIRDQAACDTWAQCIVCYDL